MDVVVKGRNCTISDEFRGRVEERIAGIARLRDRVQRVEVVVTVQQHTRQPDEAARCEITLIGAGPVVRAEAVAEEKQIAFDQALEKLKTRVRKAADRRKSHRGLRAGQVFEELAPAGGSEPVVDEPEAPVTRVGDLEITGEGPLVVREKTFGHTPLTLAQALDEMELVGHDFFLYVDAETNAPSVVYRRRGYDYGVIHLADA